MFLMIAENVVIPTGIHEEIEITCKKCKKAQKYHPRGKKIPKRPKTQCQNCGAWIYFDASLLVKDDQNQKTKNDQKKEQQKQVKFKQMPVSNQKPRFQSQTNLTKTTDQRPKNNDQKPLSQNGVNTNINFVKQLEKEMRQFNKTIPIDVKQELVNWLFKNIDQLYEGIYYYLNAWEKRYNKRLKGASNSPVIPKYEKMQKTFTKIQELIQFKQNLENMKKKKQNQLEEVLKNTKIRK